MGAGRGGSRPPRWGVGPGRPGPLGGAPRPGGAHIAGLCVPFCMEPLAPTPCIHGTSSRLASPLELAPRVGVQIEPEPQGTVPGVSAGRAGTPRGRPTPQRSAATRPASATTRWWCSAPTERGANGLGVPRRRSLRFPADPPTSGAARSESLTTSWNRALLRIALRARGEGTLVICAATTRRTSVDRTSWGRGANGHSARRRWRRPATPRPAGQVARGNGTPFWGRSSIHPA
jgi:hypothetical protein